ncbi:hypothetical protein GL263_27565 [Streptomyces durbertensis]|uniref:Uncharacterized protein n=1 Tax=Streptomyces durbertensis TaxID=2448886 RepID=A0ABR6EQ62_9ACTN|nr:hypothetical protein [Streptomyces durbertensis]MBB1247273.1 hypothetical protein [Streptomyces durbertensis]
MTAEEKDTTVEFTFDFTEQQDEPIELLPDPGPTHPPTILARSEPLMPMRFGRNLD